MDFSRIYRLQLIYNMPCSFPAFSWVVCLGMPWSLYGWIPCFIPVISVYCMLILGVFAGGFAFKFELHVFCYILFRYAVLIQYAEPAPWCTLGPKFGRPKLFDLPFSSRVTGARFSRPIHFGTPRQGCSVDRIQSVCRIRACSLVRSTGRFRSAEPWIELFLRLVSGGALIND